jgi:hypothetical protein
MWSPLILDSWGTTLFYENLFLIHSLFWVHHFLVCSLIRTYLLADGKWNYLLNVLPASIVYLCHPSILWPVWYFKSVNLISLYFEIFQWKFLDEFHFLWYIFLKILYHLTYYPMCVQSTNLPVFCLCLWNILCLLPGMPLPSFIFQLCSDLHSEKFSLNFLPRTQSFFLTVLVVLWLSHF